MQSMNFRLSELFREHTGETDSCLADDVPTGEQYDQIGRRNARSGAHLLMLAVLEEGVRSYLSSNAVVRAEAEAWVASNTRKWPFAFAAICDALGFDVDAARLGLERLRERLSGKRMRRIRRNVRHISRITVRRPARILP
jgi:hypothetical protein